MRRLVRWDTRRTSRRGGAIPRTHRRSTDAENMAFARQMMTYFSALSQEEPGWVKRMVDLAPDHDANASRCVFALLLSLNADVIERNMATTLAPGLTAYPKSGWAGHRVCARRVDCHPGHSSEVGGGRLVSEVTAPFPSRPLFG